MSVEDRRNIVNIKTYNMRLPHMTFTHGCMTIINKDMQKLADKTGREYS